MGTQASDNALEYHSGKVRGVREVFGTMPRGIPGSGATSRSSLVGQQQVWQGASLDGQRIYRLIHSPTGNWQLQQAPIGTTTTLSFAQVAQPNYFIDALAALGTQYNGLVMTGLSAAKAMPQGAGEVPITRRANSNGAAARKPRARRTSRVSVQRMTTAGVGTA